MRGCAGEAMSDPMEDKSKCCQSSVVVRGKQSSGSTNWFECCDCKLPCDVVTDSKTAREWAKQTELIIECYDGLDGGRASREETRKVLEKAFTDYASDKDKRIKELEAERDSWFSSKDGKIKGEHWEVVEDASKTILAKDKRIAQLEAENKQWQIADSKAVAALQSQLDENEKELIRLRLESEVKDEALKSVVDYYKVQGTGKIFCLGYGKDAEKENLVHKALLSPSTKSSLMEKVRAFIQIFDGQTEPLHPISWMSALTEVKKELHHA